MINRRVALAACLVALLSCGAVEAAESAGCDADVQSAIESKRNSYVNGMSGLANNNNSLRPGSYSQMSCLDNFMQGNMDIFFRPPKLDDLLQTALSFACQAIGDAMSGGGPGGQGGQSQMLDLMKTFAGGGLNVPTQGGGSQLVNMQDFMKQPNVSGAGSSSLGDLFSGLS